MTSTIPNRVGIAVCLAVAALAAGCATFGKAFDSQKIPQLSPGKTTKSEVISLLGPALSQETSTIRKDASGKDLPQPAITNMLQYAYSAPHGTGAFTGVSPARWINVYLQVVIVVGYSGGSSFKEDSSDFDPAAASSFEKGKTTRDDVIKALGAPSGRGVYPFAKTTSGTSFFYSIDLRNFPPGSKTKKRISTFFDAQGVLEDFNVNSSTEALPVAPTPVTIPIYIPPVKR
jgi:outer membrane protein assembly factor BamE (lipoprotein component of BamABCDE complex)